MCSRNQLRHFENPENRWFSQAQDCVVVTKPIHRQALWKALTNAKQQKPTIPRLAPTAAGQQFPGSPMCSPKLHRKSKSPLHWISEGEETQILLAEDNETNILVLRGFLAALGHTAKIVRDGAACVSEFARNRREAPESNKYEVCSANRTLCWTAVNFYCNGRYRLIFMDCLMPKLDGFEAATQVRAIEASDDIGSTPDPIPIVAMTGFTGAEDLDKCIAAGMTDHLPKPFSKDELAQKIKKYVAIIYCVVVIVAKNRPAGTSGTLPCHCL